MRHIFRYTVLAVVVLLVCGASLYPPREKLRLGRDLAGGATLTYEVDVAPDEDAATVIDNVINVLKDRVDPKGVMEISFVRQGRNRLEISMPLPTVEVQELKRQYKAIVEEVGDQNIDAGALDRAMRAPAEERSALLERWAAGSPSRAATLERARELYDASQQARQAYDESVAAEAAQSVQDELLEKASDAAIAYEEARAAVLAMSVSDEEIEAALAQSDAPRRIKNEATNEFDVLPSARDLSIESLKSAHPEAAADIDRAVGAYEVYESRRRGLDDPNDLKRLLRGAGMLSFRIAVEPGRHPQEDRLRRELLEKGPRGVQATDARWFQIHNPDTWYDSRQGFESMVADPRGYFGARYGLVAEQRDGVYYVLLHDEDAMAITAADGDWGVSGARSDRDDLGRPSIAFSMDARGAVLLGQLTGANVQRNMAVLLDDKVYTAPNLLSPISSSGQITGQFSPAEISYLVRTLGAGALQAKLGEAPIGEDIVGPELGADNLRHGLEAGIISFVVVAGFMVVYYFGAGLISVLALVCNAVVILGLMSLNRAAFTLPGIAGIILTFGMAVDANVLIYERIREELTKGADLKTAVRLGFDRVASTIIDANVTTLIACIVLYYTATQELKGFAVTMGVGIVGTVFSALVITRLIFALLVDTLGVRSMKQLPMVVPGLQRLMTPRVDWLKYRAVYWAVSSVIVLFGLGYLFTNGERLLDNEFRGGTAVTISLSQDPDGPGPAGAEPIERTRAEIEERIRSAFPATSPPGSLEANIRESEIVPLNPAADGVTSTVFRVKTVAQDRDAVSAAVIGALGDWVAERPALPYAGSDLESSASGPVYRILDAQLGPNIGRPEVRESVAEFVGGAAIVLEGFDEPLPNRDELEARLDQMREAPAYETISRRNRAVVVLEGTPAAVRSAAILSVDPTVSLFDEESAWRSTLAETEWDFVREAMLAPTTLTGVQSFSAAIAKTFRAQATVAMILTLGAILIYIWVRFGSVRYSFAAILSLLHDMVATVACLALANIIFHASPAVAGALMLEPFKIDLAFIAAILTIVGYSLNDTIVIMDRVRENRGRLSYATYDVINDSINQTMSRTIITTGTTLLAIFVLYVDGGAGVHAFAFALLVGVFSGAYSTVAIAAPLLFSRKDAERGAVHRRVGQTMQPRPLPSAANSGF